MTKKISELFEIEKETILKPNIDVIIALGDMIINQINIIKTNISRNNIKQYDIESIIKLIWDNHITEWIYK